MTTIIARKQFAQDCGISNKNLIVYTQRKKLVITSARCANCQGKSKPCASCREKEYIDLEYRTPEGHYINRDFYKKWAKKENIPKLPKPPKEKPPKEKPVPLVSKSVLVGVEEEDDGPEDVDFSDLSELSSEDALDRANKFKLYQNREADRRMKELQEAKLRGELMPVSDSEEMVGIFAESTKRAYMDAGESVLMLLFELFSVPENQRVMFRDKLNNSVNTAVKNAVKVAEKRIESLKNTDGQRQD